MKKSILAIAFLFFSFITMIAQEEEHSAEYKWGERNALWVILGVILVIILIIWAIRRKKK
jgi:LPXTG-motif cell wall-anchored protein